MGKQGVTNKGHTGKTHLSRALCRSLSSTPLALPEYQFILSFQASCPSPPSGSRLRPPLFLDVMLTYSAMAGCRIWYSCCSKRDMQNPWITKSQRGRWPYSPLPTWHLRVKGFTSAALISRCSLPCGQSPATPWSWLWQVGVAMAAGVWWSLSPGSWSDEPAFLTLLSLPSSLQGPWAKVIWHFTEMQIRITHAMRQMFGSQSLG